MNPRFLSINSVIRVWQVETSRTGHILEDETHQHDVETVTAFSEAVRRGFPEARITWSVSWQALHAEHEPYVSIRGLLKELHQQYSDEVTFIPGGFFPNVHISRDEVHQDIAEALERVEKTTGNRPKSLLAGFLAAENIDRANRQELGVRTVQGNIWSQYSIDSQDGDGSIAYPYYPSREHFCKPAQGLADFIDCPDLDGWTVDLVAGRMAGDYWKDGVRYVSRMGVGPIETLHTFGAEKGLEIMKATTRVHFHEENVARNPFGWVTVNYRDRGVFRNRGIGALDAFGEWVAWIKREWPDVQCPIFGDFGEHVRTVSTDNSGLNYILNQRGCGVGASYADQEVTWFMNSRFRLGILEMDSGRYVFDYTDYRQPAQEPMGLEERNWTLFGEINQKGQRPQDQPILLERWPKWEQLRKELDAIHGREKVERLLGC